MISEAESLDYRDLIGEIRRGLKRMRQKQRERAREQQQASPDDEERP